MSSDAKEKDQCGNDANRMLCAGLCLGCKHQSFKTLNDFIKRGVCLKKFWLGRKHDLYPNKPVCKCRFFEPCI